MNMLWVSIGTGNKPLDSLCLFMSYTCLRWKYLYTEIVSYTRLLIREDYFVTSRNEYELIM